MMPVVRDFPARLSIGDLLPIFDSLGAHAAAKLEHFATDERTLTDDLCDMFYIWAQNTSEADPRNRRVFTPSTPFPIVVSKTTQQEESAVGADLALTVTSPSGVKRALIQAKVFDPAEQELRCATPGGWDKLWSQLVLMQKRNGELSFLLIYVPAGLLDGQRQGYATWEQGFQPSGAGTTSSKFGVTLIAVGDLLDASGNWRCYPPVSHNGQGDFNPRGISLSKLFVDMLTCNRGKWRPYAADDAVFGAEHADRFPIHYRAYREIGVSFGEAPEGAWNQALSALSDWTDRDVQ